MSGSGRKSKSSGRIPDQISRNHKSNTKSGTTAGARGADGENNPGQNNFIHQKPGSSKGQQSTCRKNDNQKYEPAIETKLSDSLDQELEDLIKKMTITPKSGAIGSIPHSVLYYGWFLGSSVSASLKIIAENYLTICFSTSVPFQRFITNAATKANIPDPLLYYKKPESTRDKLYHVTAKFCGRKPCMDYAEVVHPYIGTEFSLEIIGIFFTESTYGFRLKLTKSQELLFDEDRILPKGISPPKSKQFKGKGADGNKSQKKGQPVQIDSEYFGIRLETQEVKNFSPSLSRAHITLGCAPGIKALQTGFDLLDIISLENQKTCHHDLEIEGGTIRQYGRGNGDAFVIYFDRKYIAEAVFMSVP